MNWFDLVIAILVMATLVRGYMSGFVMQIASLAGLILGAVFAGQLSEVIAPRLIAWTNASPHIVAPLSYIVAFVLIIVALIFAGKMLQSILEAMELSTANRLAGALLCTTKWLVLFSIIINLISEFDQNQHLIKPNVREESICYPFVIETARLAVPFLRFDFTSLSPSKEEKPQDS